MEELLSYLSKSSFKTRSKSSSSFKTRRHKYIDRFSHHYHRYLPESASRYIFSPAPHQHHKQQMQRPRWTRRLGGMYFPFLSLSSSPSSPSPSPSLLRIVQFVQLTSPACTTSGPPLCLANLKYDPRWGKFIEAGK